MLGSSIDWRLGPHGPFIGQVTLLPRRGGERGGLLDKQETEAASPRAQWRLEGLQREGRRESSHSVFVMARSTLSKSKEKRSAAVQRRGAREEGTMRASQAESIHFPPG